MRISVEDEAVFTLTASDDVTPGIIMHGFIAVTEEATTAFVHAFAHTTLGIFHGFARLSPYIFTDMTFRHRFTIALHAHIRSITEQPLSLRIGSGGTGIVIVDNGTLITPEVSRFSDGDTGAGNTVKEGL